MISIRPLALLVGLSILCLFAAVGGYRYGTARTTAHYAPMLQAHAETARQAESRARHIEREAAERVTTIADQLAEETADALADRDRTIADLRNGNLRLHDRFAACSRRVPQASGDTESSDGAEAGGFSEQDARLLLSIGAEADAVVRQLTACQALLTR